jgi:hypothetical protein
MSLGMGIDPYAFSLPHSKFIFSIEPVIDLSGCKIAEDVFHTGVEVPIEPSLEELLDYYNFDEKIPLEEMLTKHDPYFKAIMSRLGW